MPLSPQMGDLIPLSALAAGARVLDLGCGSGTLSYAQFPHLWFAGIDQYAHTHSAAWPPNARLVLGDAERLPWADSTFDAAVCNFVFEHFCDPRAALRELDRVLRPGGLLFVSIPRFDSIQDRLYRFTTNGGGHLHHYTFERFVALVYQESAFKLEGLGPAPGGFTWLNDIPWGNLIRGLLFRSFELWQRATGSNPLEASDFLLLFRRGERRGFRHILQVCSHCGDSLFELPANSNGRWKCPACAFENVLIPTRNGGP